MAQGGGFAPGGILVSGPVGPSGPQGPRGPAGPPGAPGAQGPRGSFGPRGLDGHIGPAGPIGSEGPQGEPSIGIQIKGVVVDHDDLPQSGNQRGDAWVTEENGHVWFWDNHWIDGGPMRGPLGATGPEGQEGPSGPPGIEGLEGPEGPRGAQGPRGQQGEQGPRGGCGPPGVGIFLQGSVPTAADLPQVCNQMGWAWVAEDTGDVWMWDGCKWVDLGKIQGPQGPPGPQGVEGPEGPEGDEGPVGYQGERGVSGPRGPEGPMGPPGTGVALRGTVAHAGQLPPAGNHIGDGFLDESTGHLWVWEGTKWEDEGPIRGPQGVRGPEGEEGPPGTQGERGPEGPEGVRGPQGIPGPEGPLGPPGAAGSGVCICGSVATSAQLPTPDSGCLRSCSGYIAEDTGVLWVWDGQQWIDCGQIRGPDGPPGPVGPEGPRGPQGPEGQRGPAGSEGPRGPQGELGPEGPAGPQGVAGVGINIRGEVASQSQLPPGPHEPGDAWITRDTGNLWVWNGTTFINSGHIVGPEGPRGPQGPEGPRGQRGPEGPRGPQGIQGIQGPRGERGERGPQGAQGIRGPQGQRGERGPEGPRGPQGAVGPGVNIKGEVPSANQLPMHGNQPGDAYITADTGHVWIWQGNGWVDGGHIVGPEGPPGIQGPPGSDANAYLWTQDVDAACFKLLNVSRIDGCNSVLQIGEQYASNLLDVVGMVRTRWSVTPASGSGVEMNYEWTWGGMGGRLRTFDRDAGQPLPLDIDGYPMTINAFGRAGNPAPVYIGCRPDLTPDPNPFYYNVYQVHIGPGGNNNTTLHVRQGIGDGNWGYWVSGIDFPNGNIPGGEDQRIAAIYVSPQRTMYDASMAFSTSQYGEGLQERMRIDPQGRVGIGTQNPQVQLDVYGAATVNGVIQTTGGYYPNEPFSGKALRMVFYNEGGLIEAKNYAITDWGTNPYLPLYLDGKQVFINSRNQGHVPANIFLGESWLPYPDDDPTLYSVTVAGGNYASLNIMSYFGGKLAFCGAYFVAGMNTDVRRQAEISSWGDYSSARGQLMFSTQGTNGLQEAMRITDKGWVGIGTQTPQGALDVAGDVNVTGTGTGMATGGVGINLFLSRPNSTEASVNYSPAILVLGAQTSTYSQLAMGINFSGAAWMQARGEPGGGYPLLLNPLEGRVGIGTQNPQYTLDVAGDIHCTGSIFASNFPMSDPGAGSKKIWCDPADGHRVKFAA